MVRALWPLVLLIPALGAFGQVSDSSLSLVFPEVRYEGSRGEKEALGAIQALLTSWGLVPQVRTFDALGNAHSFSQSLDVLVPGDRPERFILAVPINTGDLDDRGGDASLHAALEFLRLLSQKKPVLTVQVLFLGAEKGKGEGYPLGSHEFLQRLFLNAPAGAVYLDVQVPTPDLALTIDSLGRAAPIWMVSGVTQGLASLGIPFALKGSHPPLVRWTLDENQTVLDPWFKKEIPTVLLQSGSGDPVPKQLWAVRMSLWLENLVGSFSDGIPDHWDRHYLLFQWDRGFLILDQGTYILIFLTLMACALGLLFFKYDRIRDYSSSILRHLWQVPVIFAALFTFLYSATLVLNFLLRLRDLPDLWLLAPGLFLGLKVAFALFCFYFLFFLFRRMPLIRWSVFYVAAALILNTILLLLALLTGLANSFYFLWSLGLTVLFSLWKNRIWRLLLIFLQPLWLVKSIVDTFTQSQDLPLIQAVLFNPVWGNLVLTLMIIPVVMLFSAYHYMTHQQQVRNERLWNESFSVMTAGASVALMGFVLTLNPFTADVPLRWVDDADYISGTREVRVSSPVRWSGGTLRAGNREYPLPEESFQALYDAPLPEDWLKVTATRTEFLDRRRWRMTLNSPGKPEYIRVLLSSPDPLVIFQSNFPFTILPGAKEAEIHIGRYPTLPLVLDLTVLQEGELSVSWEMAYSDLPYSLQGIPKGWNLAPSLVIHRRTLLQDDLP